MNLLRSLTLSVVGILFFSLNSLAGKENLKNFNGFNLHSISGHPSDKAMCATGHFNDHIEKFLGKSQDQFSAFDFQPLSREELEKKGRTFDKEGNIIPERVGQITEFWAINVASNALERVPATLMRVTDHAYLYVENGKVIDPANLDRIAEQFDSQIYPKSKEYFGDEVSPGIDFDHRITLLFLDIQDGWEPGKGYIGGYFYPLNEVSTRIFPQSNEREMFYLDIYPSDTTKFDYLGVLGHEFHHLIHFSHDPQETKWVNEGCAQLNFYVTGYGHPGQIFSFLPRPDKQLTLYEQSVVDYGVSYLWFYYLYTKYAGSDEEARKDFFRKLVDSKLKGEESINQELKNIGVEKDFEAIFQDWSVANLVNAHQKDSLLGYDKTLNFSVYDTQVHTSLPVDSAENKDTVTPHGNDYIRFTTSELWAPRNPIIYGKVKVFAPESGTVSWNLNGNMVPEQKNWPAGSTLSEDGKTVSSPLSENGDGRFSAEFGPFHTLAGVKTLNFQTRHSTSESSPRTIPFITKDFSNGLLSHNNRGNLVIDFDGGKGGFLNKKAYFVVQALSFDKEGNFTRHTMELDENGMGSLTVAGYGDTVTEVVLIPSARGKKALGFTYKARIEGDSLNANLTLKTLREIGDLKKDFLNSYSKNGLGAVDKSGAETLLHMEDQLNTQLIKIGTTLAKSDTKGFANFTQELSQPKGADSHQQVLKSLKTQIETELVQKSEAIELQTNSEDTAHSNWDYLLFKLGENVHALTHLKIDPDMLEGQILQTYKLLQVIMGLPNIPFPDGLAIVDYKGEKLQALADKWKAEGKEEDKAVCKRLFLATFFVENVYNDSLTLADDTFTTVVEAADMIWASNKTIRLIAGGLQDVPIVGTIAQKVKYLILSKTLRLVDDLIWVINPYVPQKYQKYMPIASLVVLNVLPHVLGVKPEAEQTMPYKKLISFAVKTLGKYTVSSLPKIGYVARTQDDVDFSVGKAEQSSMTGTHDEAEQFTTMALYDMRMTTGKKIELSAKERKIADITNKIFQIAKLGMLIDPTHISKVVSIAAAVATGGLLSHAAANTGIFYFKHPRLSHDGVLKVFDPAINPGGETEDRGLFIKATHLAKGPSLLNAALAEFQPILDELKLSVQKGEVENLENLLDRASERDAHLSGTLSVLQGLAMSTLSAQTDNENLRGDYMGLIREVTTLDFEQAQLYASLVSFSANPKETNTQEATLQAIDRVEKSQNSLVSRANQLVTWQSLHSKRTLSLEYIQAPRFIRNGQTARVSAVVVNYGDKAVENTVLELTGTRFTKVETPLLNLGRLASGAWKEVSFTLTGENIEFTKDGALLLTIEGEGAPVTHRTLFIEGLK